MSFFTKNTATIRGHVLATRFLNDPVFKAQVEALYFSFLNTQPLDEVVAQLHEDIRYKSMAQDYGLAIHGVTWEDVARNYNSCTGPNISDMTLQVSGSKYLMPIVRPPNFKDRSADLSPSLSLFVLTLEGGVKVTTKEFLSSHIKVKDDKVANLWDGRDNKGILVSPQACILPLSDGTVEFNSYIYNYRRNYDSTNPTLLVVLATSFSTTAQVVPHEKVALYAKDAEGKARTLMARRLEDDRRAKGKPLTGPMDADEQERNLIRIFCVPLRPKETALPQVIRGGFGGGSYAASFSLGGTFGGAPPPSSSLFGSAVPQGTFGFGLGAAIQQSDFQFPASFGGELSAPSSVEFEDDDDYDFQGGGDELKAQEVTLPPPVKRGMDHAMLELGSVVGDFPKSALPETYAELVRDSRFPIRLTLQRYRCTDSPEISRLVLQEIAGDINASYNLGSNEGSLVTDANSRVTAMQQ